jgi:hypothetical protein
MWRRPWVLWAAVSLSLAGVVVGFAMWVQADSGSKAVDLGSGLVATGLFGLIFIGLERALAARLQEGTDTVSGLLPGGPELRDEDVDLAGQGGPIKRPQPGGSSADPYPHEYSAEFAGWQRDGSRVDAYQVRVRVYRDRRYFQFFTGVVPGMAVDHLASGVSLTAIQRASALETVRIARERILQGVVPLDDPISASEVLVQPEALEMLVRRQPADGEALQEGDRFDTWLL